MIMKIIDIKFLFLVKIICVFSGCDESDTDPILGCTNESADNYNSEATEDDGSCIWSGCMDETACNYDSEATEDDGACQYALDNPIEIISYDEYVTGLVGEELVSHVYIRNASCEEIILDASQSGVHPSVGQAKFCLGPICYEWGETEAAVTLPLASFEEGDHFQGYFKSDAPVIHEVTYTLFTDNNSVELSVTFEVTD